MTVQFAPTAQMLLVLSAEIAALTREVADRYAGTMADVLRLAAEVEKHEPSILSCPQAPAGHGALRTGGCAFAFS